VKRFFHVTLPALAPSFALSLSTNDEAIGIRSVLILTEGGPGDASHVVAWRIYVETFRNLSFGTRRRNELYLALATLALSYFVIRALAQRVAT